VPTFSIAAMSQCQFHFIPHVDVSAGSTRPLISPVISTCLSFTR
jgi:hypothetical protein